MATLKSFNYFDPIPNFNRNAVEKEYCPKSYIVRGLNIEAKCTNKKCMEYNRRKMIS